MSLVDLDSPRYPQEELSGRFKHFWSIVRPQNFFANDKELDDAKLLVDTYKTSPYPIPPGSLEEERLWNAKALVDSGFHPDTGEKVFALGRMSYQIPVNTVVCGCMLYFRHTLPQLMFWQWANQSVNSMVNYCNRNATVEMTNTDMCKSYFLATGSSWVLAIALNRIVKPGTLMARLVPFFAGAGPQALNVGFVRQKELKEGISLFEDPKLTKAISTATGTAEKFITPAIYASTITWGVRVAMATPSVAGTAIVMSKLEPFLVNRGMTRGVFPATLIVYPALLTFATPFGLSIWPQVQSMRYEKLLIESDRLKLLDYSRRMNMGDVEQKTFYYNKGL